MEKPGTPSGTDRNEERTLRTVELISYLTGMGVEIHGAIEVPGFASPPLIRNDGFGSGRPHRPDVIGFDPAQRCIVFGLVRLDGRSLDCEESLEEYNVFLDHNAGRGAQASRLYVLIPARFLQEFTSLITHYIHREYWHRIVPLEFREESNAPTP
jgi:hypothetical protein